MFLLLAAAAAITPDDAVGRWRTETRNGIVELSRCGASICGRLVTSDGLRTNPMLTDINNKDPKLRGRRLQGLMILGGFTRGADGWSGGTIYNADDGRTYSARITFQDQDHLRVRGCVFVPLCKTQTWTRAR